ncbi:MAG: glycosyltransferase N-terminal domain-containing protein [Ignavibacteria bacterium]
MKKFWFIVYNIFGIPLIWLFFKLYSVFNSKVRQGLKERRGLFNDLSRSLSHLKNNKSVIIHSSSLGEYQQAIPLADEFTKKNYNVVISFFSPSGFNNAKIVSDNVIKTYIPLDSISNQRKFLDLIKPEILIFMRYDLWYNILNESGKRGVKRVLANARYDENDSTWNIPVISSFKKNLYGMIDTAFVIDDFDEKNYKEKLKDEKTEIVKIGDSKFERVLQSVNIKSATDDVIPQSVINSKKVFVIGSAWKEDEEVIFPAIDKSLGFENDLLTVLVPHEPKETKISVIEKIISQRYENISSIRLSDIENFKGENLIIVDRIGILSKLYGIAYLSYVGGGFKTGLHNILEPAIFNMPILFSNKVKNSDEDEILIEKGCGIVIKDTKQFYRVFREFLTNKELRDMTGAKCRLVFENSKGIAEKIVNQIT